MDLAKFVCVLKDRALWFSPPTALGDPFEGSYARPNIEVADAMVEEAIEDASAPALSQREMRLLVRNFQQHIYLNCWHLNEFESAAMWDLYARSGQGVAISTTFSRLGESLVPAPAGSEDYEIHAGMVTYRDYELDGISLDNAFNLVLSKRMSFAHEHELRLGTLVIDKDDDGRLLAYPGVNVRLDLELLLEKVYVSPGNAAWYRDVVASVLAHYGFSDVPVYRSSLDDSPLV
jgi:hypothetical protein